MGLAERRRIALIKESSPQFQKAMDEATGLKLTYEIDIASFPEDKTVLDCYDSYAHSYGPGMVVDLMKSVCADDLGKDAVKAKFQKIVFQNTAKKADEKGGKELKLENGTLWVRESFHGHSDQLFSHDELRRQVESML
jgi:hypothetical protein